MRDSNDTLSATSDTAFLDRKAATVKLDNCQAAAWQLQATTVNESEGMHGKSYSELWHTGDSCETTQHIGSQPISGLLHSLVCTDQSLPKPTRGPTNVWNVHWSEEH